MSTVSEKLEGVLSAKVEEVRVIASQFEGKEDRILVIFRVELPQAQSIGFIEGLELDLGPTSCLRRLWANKTKTPAIGAECKLNFDCLEEQEEWFETKADNNGKKEIGHVVMIYPMGANNPVKEHKRSKEAFEQSLKEIAPEINIELGATVPA